MVIILPHTVSLIVSKLQAESIMKHYGSKAEYLLDIQIANILDR